MLQQEWIMKKQRMTLQWEWTMKKVDNDAAVIMKNYKRGDQHYSKNVEWMKEGVAAQ